MTTEQATQIALEDMIKTFQKAQGESRDRERNAGCGEIESFESPTRTIKADIAPIILINVVIIVLVIIIVYCLVHFH